MGSRHVRRIVGGDRMEFCPTHPAEVIP
jgi:hypothetical protein